jgi:hypothetical protein
MDHARTHQTPAEKQFGVSAEGLATFSEFRYNGMDPCAQFPAVYGNGAHATLLQSVLPLVPWRKMESFLTAEIPLWKATELRRKALWCYLNTLRRGQLATAFTPGIISLQEAWSSIAMDFPAILTTVPPFTAGRCSCNCFAEGVQYVSSHVTIQASKSGGTANNRAFVATRFVRPECVFCSKPADPPTVYNLCIVPDRPYVLFVDGTQARDFVHTAIMERSGL